MVCGEVHDSRVMETSTDSELVIHVGSCFMMHSIDEDGTPFEDFPEKISDMVAYHMLRSDGKTVRSSRVLGFPDKNARLDMRSNPEQVATFTLNKDGHIVRVFQTQSIEMVVDKVRGSGEDREVVELFTPVVGVAYTCKDAYE